MKKGQSLNPKRSEKRRASQRAASQKYRDKNWEYRLIGCADKSPKYKKIGIDRQFLTDLWKTQHGLCFWTQVPMITYSESPRHPQLVSIDRIDSTKNYISSNVVLTCTFANFGKSSTDVRTWFTFLRLLRESLLLTPACIPTPTDASSVLELLQRLLPHLSKKSGQLDGGAHE
jgi:hypothetical protein